MSWSHSRKTAVIQGNSQNRRVVYSYNVPIQAVPSVTSSSTSSSKPSQNVQQFEQECLDEHNRLRKLHSCPPLKLNRNLCNIATQYAQKIASRNVLQHSGNGYGENLFMAGGMNVDGRIGVKSWYDEISDYNYSRPGFAMGTGHFTQVIWKGTKEMGVGFAKNGSNTYVVANYDPPGNVTNQFTANVPKKEQ